MTGQPMFWVLMDPQKYGFTVCPHCNGNGSSLKDPEDVFTCTRCGGYGVVKEEES